MVPDVIWMRDQELLVLVEALLEMQLALFKKTHSVLTPTLPYK
ncbi:hypothetical protein SAMN03159489_04448 [Pseudomonas sp. NFPP07]|nr:hypothetical protein SAMN03159489_04448 [Pseudomonas sp. NFPP07]